MALSWSGSQNGPGIRILLPPSSQQKREQEVTEKQVSRKEIEKREKVRQEEMKRELEKVKKRRIVSS